MTLPQPTPQFFGPTDERLFGWLHAPGQSSDASIGLLVCNPFGFEAVCAHRGLAYFAREAAAAGIPSFRFDYAGTGDSQGDEFAPNTPDAWVRSIHHAIDHLKASSGVQTVCLLGVRLGATLAALAAAERDDVCGLVAIAPADKGRSHVREMRVLGRATESGGLESAGFVLDRETLEALGRLDLHALARAPAPRVLIVERDDLPGSRDWHRHLEGLGAQVRTEAWPGYAAMLEDAQRAKAPVFITEGVLAWLKESPPVLRSAAARPAATTVLRLPSGVVETIVKIEVAASWLFGIASAPTGGEPANGRRSGVLMINSGSVHHIGPNRLWVQLARRWAARGVTVLRIDLSGIGDSPARVGQPENIVYSQVAMRDIARAVEHMKEQQGVDDVHLMGLCSGAFHAFTGATKGLGAASAIVINPLTYFWDYRTAPGTLTDYEVLQHTSRYRHKLFSADPWLRLMRYELDLPAISAVLARGIRGSASRAFGKFKRALGRSEAQDLDAVLTAAGRHGVRLRFVFASGHAGYELMQRDARRAVSRLVPGRNISFDFISGADHTFTGLDARAQLIVTLDRLMFNELQSTAPASSAKTAAPEFGKPSQFGTPA